MRNRFLMRRAILLLAVLASARVLAQPAPAPAPDTAAAAAVAPLPPVAPTAPADPVLSARCQTNGAAFGCANAANLRLMARGSDLASGQPLSPASGALEAAAVTRLLTDTVKDLRREGTGAGGGAGNSGGGQ